MILPASHAAALLLMVLSMLCWGSWANAQKASKLRFELFYFDFAIGVFLTALVMIFTFGSLGTDLSFEDSMLITGKKNLFYAFLGGMVFNFGNMLLAAAVSVAGLSVAFPIAIGVSLILGSLFAYFVASSGIPMFLFAGCLLVAGAVFTAAAAHGRYQQTTAKRRNVSWKGVMLSLLGGLFMGMFYPILQASRTKEVGLIPYAVVFIFAIGVVFSTLIYNLYFLNLPVQGQPVHLKGYFLMRIPQHIWGLLAGAVWCTGLSASMAAAAAPPSANAGPDLSYAIGQGSAIVAALWGLLLWKEFAEAEAGVRKLLLATFVLFAAGLVLIIIGAAS